jgi:hypothetical protein
VVGLVAYAGLTAGLFLAGRHFLDRSKGTAPDALEAWGGILVLVDRPDQDLRINIRLDPPSQPATQDSPEPNRPRSSWTWR